jgi:hypothetical protein
MSAPARPTPTVALVDPATYEVGPPLELLDRLRARTPVAWIDEPALHGQPAGPGFWLVLRHADVERVLRDPATFSSWLGATQVRDAGDLDWVRRMMLNTDPPDHTRLRRLLTRSFTPRAVAALTEAIETTATRLIDRMVSDAREGRCDFTTDVAADLPLLTLAEVLGVPAEDRWLLFDWSNRVIGWQDPDYATSAAFDATQGTAMARQAVALRPTPGADGRMPDPRTRAGMPDLYAYARLLADEKRRSPGRDVTSILLAQVDEVGGAVSDAEFENVFWLFAVAGNETLRNGLPEGWSHSCSTRTRWPPCAPTRPCSPVRSTRCCAGGPRSWCSGGRQRGTSSSPVPASGLGTRSSPPSRRRTGTRRSSPPRTASTSAAPPTRTCPSGTGHTSASAVSWPGSRCARSSGRCCAAPASWSWTGRRRCCGRTSSVGSKRLPIRWTAA